MARCAVRSLRGAINYHFEDTAVVPGSDARRRLGNLSFSRVWHDPALRRLASNAVRLVGSNGIQAVMGLVATVIAARSLGAVDFGRLSIAVVFCMTTMQLLSFQSGYAVVKVGTEVRERDGVSSFLGVVRAGIVCDVVSAVLAAAIAVLAALSFSTILGLTSEDQWMVVILSAGIATNVTGAPTAILRMTDRYNALLWHGVITGVSKVALSVAALALGGGLLHFSIGWALAQVISNGFLFVLGLGEMGRQRRPHSIPIAGLRSTFASFPQLRSILVISNLTSSLRMIRDIDVMLVGWLLDSAAAGLFRVARQAGAALNKLIDPFFHAIYPDMATINQLGGARETTRLARNASLVLGSCCVIVLILFLLFGNRVLTVLLGSDFHNAYAAAVFCIIASVIWSFSHPFFPALMVWGRHRTLLRITAITSFAYLALVFFGARYLGVSGAGLAYAAFQGAWALLVGAVLLKEARLQLAMEDRQKGDREFHT